MTVKTDFAIGIAMFARSIVACDACLVPIELSHAGAAIRTSQAQVIAEPLKLGFLIRRGHSGGLAQDPARSRPAAAPVPMPIYEMMPLRG